MEVKGIRTLGEKVTPAANEEEHTRYAADCDAEHILYVLSQIAVTDSGTITCSGGMPTRLWPWAISGKHLIPTEYAYTVQAASGTRSAGPGHPRVRIPASRACSRQGGRARPRRRSRRR